MFLSVKVMTKRSNEIANELRTLETSLKELNQDHLVLFLKDDHDEPSQIYKQVREGVYMIYCYMFINITTNIIYKVDEIQS